MPYPLPKKFRPSLTIYSHGNELVLEFAAGRDKLTCHVSPDGARRIAGEIHQAANQLETTILRKAGQIVFPV